MLNWKAAATAFGRNVTLLDRTVISSFFSPYVRQVCLLDIGKSLPSRIAIYPVNRKSVLELDWSICVTQFVKSWTPFPISLMWQREAFLILSVQVHRDCVSFLKQTLMKPTVSCRFLNVGITENQLKFTALRYWKLQKWNLTWIYLCSETFFCLHLFSELLWCWFSSGHSSSPTGAILEGKERASAEAVG